MFNNRLNVLLAGSSLGWTSVTLPWGHNRVREVENANAVFLWVEDVKAAMTFQLGVELGQAQLLRRPIYAAGPLPFVQALTNAKIPLKGFRVDDNPVRAYEVLLADKDVGRVSVESRPVAAKCGGICVACGSRYGKEESILWVQESPRTKAAAHHVDCYRRKQDPRHASAALFHAGLTEALRLDNAKLEVRVAELEAQLRESRR